MTLLPCGSSSDRGARYGAQAGAYLGTKTGAKLGGPFATGFNAGLGAALGYVGGSLLDGAKPTLVPDGGEPADNQNTPHGSRAGPRSARDSAGSDDAPTDIPVTEGPLFE